MSQQTQDVAIVSSRGASLSGRKYAALILMGRRYGSPDLTHVVLRAGDDTCCYETSRQVKYAGASERKPIQKYADDSTRQDSKSSSKLPYIGIISLYFDLLPEIDLISSSDFHPFGSVESRTMYDVRGTTLALGLLEACQIVEFVPFQ